jgi:pilus assembly protein Flp/PilA
MLCMLSKLFREEEGAAALEYGLLAALIALVMAGGAVILGEGLNKVFGDVGTAVEGTAPTTVPTPNPTY